MPALISFSAEGGRATCANSPSVGFDLFHPSLTHHFELDFQRRTWSALDTSTESLLLSSTGVDCCGRVAT
jgi:hypothetical protein